MTDEPKDPREQFREANEELRGMPVRPIMRIGVLPDSLAAELVRAGLAYDPEIPSLNPPRTLRFDTMKFNEEQRVFEVEGHAPDLTHVILRGHSLAFQAFREQVIEEILAAVCRCEFSESGGFPMRPALSDQAVHELVLEQLRKGGDACET